jgi:hypothetical protein
MSEEGVFSPRPTGLSVEFVDWIQNLAVWRTSHPLQRWLLGGHEQVFGGESLAIHEISPLSIK